MVPRLTTAAAEIGGATIPPGAEVLLCLAAANRDPARFPEPAALRLGRSPAANLSFGGGAHRCIGAALARSQVSIALGELFRAAPEFRAAEPLAAVRYAPGAPFNQLERLVIRR
jgi:cytochrome P450